jgi:TPR repeat protein
MKHLILIIITVVAFLEVSLRLGANEDADDFIEPVLASADNGNATAQALVGTMYYYGYGLNQDYKKALVWYKLAAESGEVSAQATLGRMHYLGHAVRQDLVQAHKWYDIASINGHQEAGSYRHRVSEKMSHDQIIEAQELAASWFYKSEN